MKDFALLKENLSLSIVKKEGDQRTASLAETKNGGKYIAGYTGSDTHLLDILSEQGALLLSVQSNDFPVKKITTLADYEKKGELISPLAAKILIDYVKRTGSTLAYTVLNINGDVIFETDDVTTLFPHYRPVANPLQKIQTEKISPNMVHVPPNTKNITTLLKKYAIEGIRRNFPTYDSASGYGTAIITKNGNVYFSGQYSSFEKRTNIHSEMAAPLAAFMKRDYDITHLGLVSTKFKDEPVHMCGCCRQYLSEMARKFNFNPKIYCFAMENDIHSEHALTDYLPHVWTSKKW